MDHVVFQDGVPLENEADDAHGNDRRGNGGGNGHANAQAQVSVGAAEHHGQDGAQDHGKHGELRHDLVCRNKRLEFLFFHVFLSF